MGFRLAGKRKESKGGEKERRDAGSGIEASSHDGVGGGWLLHGKSTFSPFPSLNSACYVFSCSRKHSSRKMRLIGALHVAVNPACPVGNFCRDRTTSFSFPRGFHRDNSHHPSQSRYLSPYIFIQGIQYRCTYEIESD